MASRMKPKTDPPPPAAGAVPDEEWDAVSQASWESFPASDPPAWIHAPRHDRPVAKPTN